MQDIKELGLQEIEELMRQWQVPLFYGREILLWIYQKAVIDFAAMTNLPAGLRDRLKEKFCLRSLRPVERRISRDGTEKFLFATKERSLIEAVGIPQKPRFTACVSSQAGCRFNCCFCASAILGFKRNLTSAEMLDELFYLSSSRKSTHIVFMGTGEPLDNYENVLKAIRAINADYGFAIGARRVTISTCGIIPGIKRLAREGLQLELSVSLHAADEKTRSRIMPVNKKYPLPELIAACRQYIKVTNRQVTFEYVLLKGLNSDLQSAEKLSRIVRDLRLAKVNLIPANRIAGLGFEPPPRDKIILFRDYLLRRRIKANLRKSRGEDIAAACGQLRLNYEEK